MVGMNRDWDYRCESSRNPSHTKLCGCWAPVESAGALISLQSGVEGNTLTLPVPGTASCNPWHPPGLGHWAPCQVLWMILFHHNVPAEMEEWNHYQENPLFLWLQLTRVFGFPREMLADEDLLQFLLSCHGAKHGRESHWRGRMSWFYSGCRLRSVSVETVSGIIDLN